MAIEAKSGEGVSGASAPSGISSLARVFIGLLIAFVLPIQPFFDILQALLQHLTNCSTDTAWGSVDVGYYFLTATLIVALVHFWEGQPLASMGLRRVRAAEVLIGVAAFIVADVATAMLLPVLKSSSTAAEAAAKQLSGEIWALPVWVRVGMVLGTSLAEELGARGYAIERLTTLTKSRSLAATLAFLGALAMHVPYRGWDSVRVLAPGLLILVLLYLWRRNVTACVTAHILLDGEQMIVWPWMPLRVQRFLAERGL